MYLCTIPTPVRGLEGATDPRLQAQA